MERGNRVTACTDAVGALQNSKHNIRGEERCVTLQRDSELLFRLSCAF